MEDEQLAIRQLHKHSLIRVGTGENNDINLHEYNKTMKVYGIKITSNGITIRLTNRNMALSLHQ